jgi:hypothetical protein
MGNQREPWQMDPLEVTIVDGYEAEIFGEEEDSYWITFHDEDMTPVEAKLKKAEFRNWPHPPMDDPYFGIMLYLDMTDNGKFKLCAWPLKHNWNPELLEHNENDTPVKVGNIEKTSNQSVIILENGIAIVYEGIIREEDPLYYTWKEHSPEGVATGLDGVITMSGESLGIRSMEEGMNVLVLEEYRRKKKSA